MKSTFQNLALLVCFTLVMSVGCTDTSSEQKGVVISGTLEEKLDTLVCLTYFSDDLQKMRRLEDTLLATMVSDSNTYTLEVDVDPWVMSTLRVGSFVVFANKILVEKESPTLSGSITEVHVEGAPSLEKQLAFEQTFMSTAWAKLANKQRQEIGTQSTLEWYEQERKRAHSWIDSAFQSGGAPVVQQYLHVLADFYITDRKLSAIDRFKFKGESGLLTIDFCADLPWGDSLAQESYLYHHLLAKVPQTHMNRLAFLAADTTTMTPEEIGIAQFKVQLEEKSKAIETLITDENARKDAYFKLVYSDIMRLATLSRTAVSVNEAAAEAVFMRIDKLDAFIETLPELGVTQERVNFLKTLRDERL